MNKKKSGRRVTIYFTAETDYLLKCLGEINSQYKNNYSLAVRDSFRFLLDNHKQKQKEMNDEYRKGKL